MRKLYRFMIEVYWKIEHIPHTDIATFGFRRRKLWEHKYVARFNENIYGDRL